MDKGTGEGSAYSQLSHGLEKLKEPPPTRPGRPVERSNSPVKSIQGDITSPSSKESGDTSHSNESASIRSAYVEEGSSSDGADRQFPPKNPSLPFPRRASLSDYLGTYIFAAHSKTQRSVQRRPRTRCLIPPRSIRATCLRLISI